MLTVRTRVKVKDGRLEATLPTPVPPGDHEAVIVIDAVEAATPSKFDISKFPVHHAPWDESISLRREDMYGDDGR